MNGRLWPCLAAALSVAVASPATAARPVDASVTQPDLRPGCLSGSLAGSSSGSPYVLQKIPTLLTTLTGLVVLGVLDAAVAPTLAQAGLCRKNAAGSCDATRLVALDRGSLGYDRRSWRRASDVLQPTVIVAALTATGVLAALAAPPDRRAADTATDLLVGAEAVTATALVTTLLKYAIRRPRPTAYRPTVGTGVGQVLSFPSGHTGAVFASGAALVTDLWLRPTPLPVRLFALGAATGLGTVVALGRVFGGQHFPTDVIAGAALGTGLGVALPWLHRRRLALSVAFDAEASDGRHWHPYLALHGSWPAGR